MPRFIIFSYLILILSTFSGELIGPLPLRDNPVLSLRTHINLGEELTYTASWEGFPAGNLHARVWPKLVNNDGTPLAMFELRIKSNDFISAFYPVNSQIRSYVEIDTGVSRVFSRKMREDDYRTNDVVVFDYASKDSMGNSTPKIDISLIRGNIQESQTSRNIPGRISDPLAFGWLIRALPIERVGDKAAVIICDRYATGIVSLTVLDEERIVVPYLGEFDCLLVRPEATTYSGKENLLQFKGEARFWVEKNTRIILKAESSLPIGKASAVLASYENCDLDKYNLEDSSKIKKAAK